MLDENIDPLEWGDIHTDPLLGTFEGDGFKLAGIDTCPAICTCGAQNRLLFLNAYCCVGTRRDAEFTSLALFFMNNNRHNQSFSYPLYSAGKSRTPSSDSLICRAVQLLVVLQSEEGLLQNEIQDILCTLRRLLVDHNPFTAVTRNECLPDPGR